MGVIDKVPDFSCPGSSPLYGRDMQNSKDTTNQWAYRPFLQEPLVDLNLLNTDSGILGCVGNKVNTCNPGYCFVGRVLEKGK